MCQTMSLRSARERTAGDLDPQPMALPDAVCRGEELEVDPHRTIVGRHEIGCLHGAGVDASDPVDDVARDALLIDITEPDVDVGEGQLAADVDLGPR